MTAAKSARAAPASGARFREPGWRNGDILRAALLVAGVYLAFQLLWVARSILLVGFLGVLFGVTLTAGVNWLQRRGVPRGVGALILVVMFLGGFVGLGMLAAPRLTAQWQDLRTQLPAALSRVESWVKERQGGVVSLLTQPDSADGQPDTTGRQKEGGQPNRPAEIRRTLADEVDNLGASFFTVFSSTLTVLGAILIIAFVAVYIAVDPETYRRGIMHLVPHRARPKAAELLQATGVSLRRWLVAQFIGMVVIGAITTAALLVIDVRAAIALGIIAGIFEFIPYFGPIMSAVPAIAMGFLDGPEKALWVLAAYVAIQQIEGNLLMPYLMQEGLDLPPVLTILGQAVLALVFGFIGLVIAMPLLGAVMVPIKLLYVQDVVGDDVALPGGASG